MLPPARTPLILFASSTRWLVHSFESILVPSGHRLVHSEDDGQLARSLTTVRPDLVLLETELDDDDSLESCRALRRDPAIGPHTPIVLVCPRVPSRRIRLDALRAGAWEVFAFPIDPEEVVLKVGLFAGIRAEMERVEEQGMLDVQTGLYNARGLVRRAQQLTAEAHRHQRAIACVVVGLSLADELHAGERMERWVKPVSEVIRRVARESDTIGRLRNAEFAILGPQTGWFGARRMAERLVEELRELVRGTGDAKPMFEIHTGCHALEEVPSPALQPVHLVVQALQALRKAQFGDGAEAGSLAAPMAMSVP